MSEFRYVVTEEDAGADLKTLLRQKFDFSARFRTRIKRDQLMRLNDQMADAWITPKAGDVLTVLVPEETSGFMPEPIPISILFEDDSLLVVNKQPGLPVHPTKGHPLHTLANGLMQYLLDTGQSFKIRFINRLDMDTSGLVVVAKNSHSQADFMKQSQKNQVEKRYLAIVKGVIEEAGGVIDLPIGMPDPLRVERAVTADGRPSVTRYTVLERFPAGFTLLELQLETGRTHQIRVHLSHIGHPVVGDHLYGGSTPFLIERQALHAWKLAFRHPVTGEWLQFEAPVPADMEALLGKVRE